MNEDVSIEVGFATDWKQYSQVWMNSMQHLYWYNENPVFDFNKDEELDEMQADFDTPGNLFLEARVKNSNDIVGVLGLRYRDVMARIRRWEPAVLSEYRKSLVADTLLDRALEHLTSIGVRRIGYLLKHPVDSPELVNELINQYQNFRFNISRPDSVDLVMSLDGWSSETNSPTGVVVDTGENYTFEDLATITVKSFTSTPEEREIHGFDKTVTEHIQATALLQRMA
ncbi:MAG: GNAT family N-acetyltransferase, partial [Candidatus Thorarchaeota archaeon]